MLSARLAGETSERVGGEADDGADTAAATALMMVATAVGFWALAIATRRPVLPADVPGAAWPGIVGIGLISTFVAIQTFYAGTKRVGAAQASLISTFEPVWTITLAALLFGETLGPLQLVGGRLRDRRRPARPDRALDARPGQHAAGRRRVRRTDYAPVASTPADPSAAASHSWAAGIRMGARLPEAVRTTPGDGLSSVR